MSGFPAFDLVVRADHHHNTTDCTKDTCPATDSIYGYAPSLVASILFAAIFAVSTLVYIVQAWMYRKAWLAFSIVLALGCVAECVGYIARVMLHNDPFSDLGFKLSIVLLTFAPAFMSGAIYLLLKHIALAFGPQWSRLRPALYTWIFVACDILSILMQSAGGALSAVADDNQKLLNAGVDVMIAGLAFQVFTLLVFGLLAADFLFRTYRNSNQLSASSVAMMHSTKFKSFLGAATLAYFFIFIRCCYRVAELSGGWGNPIMRNEPEFIVLDSVMVAVSVVVLNLFHPGRCFHKPSKNAGLDEEYGTPISLSSREDMQHKPAAPTSNNF